MFAIGMPGMTEWLVIGLFVALFFGARRLPELGKGLGEGLRGFRDSLKGKDEDESEPSARTELEQKQES